jgi:hypothetical protein
MIFWIINRINSFYIVQSFTNMTNELMKYYREAVLLS